MDFLELRIFKNLNLRKFKQIPENQLTCWTDELVSIEDDAILDMVEVCCPRLVKPELRAAVDSAKSALNALVLVCWDLCWKLNKIKYYSIYMNREPNLLICNSDGWEDSVNAEAGLRQMPSYALVS